LDASRHRQTHAIPERGAIADRVREESLHRIIEIADERPLETGCGFGAHDTAAAPAIRQWRGWRWLAKCPRCPAAGRDAAPLRDLHASPARDHAPAATPGRADRDRNTARSAAARAALESVAFAPTTVLPQRGVAWRAESERVIIGRFDLP